LTGKGRSFVGAVIVSVDGGYQRVVEFGFFRSRTPGASSGEPMNSIPAASNAR
jgi:hypothetical protein